MLQIACLVVALLAVITGVKAFTPSGIELKKGHRLEGGAATVAGLIAIGLGVAIAIFGLFVLPKL